MKFVARHLNLIGLLLLVSFAAAAAGLYLDVPQKVQAARLKPAPAQFACPMHPNVTGSTATDCPECGMKLAALSAAKAATSAHGDGCCNKPAAAPAPAPVAAPTATGCPHLDAVPKPGCGDGCSHH